MSDSQQILTTQQIDAAGLTGWQFTDDTLQATFATGDFATGLRLVNLIGESAESANHHPDVTLTYPSVAITVSSHDVGGVTSRDVDLAARITAHADALGVSAKS